MRNRNQIDQIGNFSVISEKTGSVAMSVVTEPINDRGGVEDTRLEAKDTKKIRGQGQPFRGQTLSKPRTGMLGAKDQGHKRKCSPKKKKGLHKNFSGDLQKKKKRSSQKFFKRSTKF